jgi:hypothetical protein
MKVHIKDKNQAISEMTDSGAVGVIAEMVTDPEKLDDFFPGMGLGAKGKLLAEAAGDEKPEFPVLRVEEGWSHSKRLWTAEQIESIVAQTNQLEPVGHLGHIPDADASTAFPEPQTTWIGAVTKMESSKLKDRKGQTVKTAYFAGYNLPGAKVRTYIRTRAVRGISWWGRGDQIVIPGKGVEVRNFTLKAIDWARKLSEGMPTSALVGITSEMEERMDKELAQVTPAEFKEANPNGYQLLVAEATRESNEKISEMEVEVESGNEAKSQLQKVMEALGIDKADEILSKITELQDRIGDKAKATVDSALDKLLEQKVSDPEKRALVKRLIPASSMGEMETKVSDSKDTEEAEKYVGEMLDEVFNKDEMIQGIVSGQSPPVVRRREEIHKNDSDSDTALKSYDMKRERVQL